MASDGYVTLHSLTISPARAHPPGRQANRRDGVLPGADEEEKLRCPHRELVHAAGLLRGGLLREVPRILLGIATQREEAPHRRPAWLLLRPALRLPAEGLQTGHRAVRRNRGEKVLAQSRGCVRRHGDLRQWRFLEGEVRGRIEGVSRSVG